MYCKILDEYKYKFTVYICKRFPLTVNLRKVPSFKKHRNLLKLSFFWMVLTRKLIINCGISSKLPLSQRTENPMFSESVIFRWFMKTKVN